MYKQTYFTEFQPLHGSPYRYDHVYPINNHPPAVQAFQAPNTASLYNVSTSPLLTNKLQKMVSYQSTQALTINICICIVSRVSSYHHHHNGNFVFGFTLYVHAIYLQVFRYVFALVQFKGCALDCNESRWVERIFQ